MKKSTGVLIFIAVIIILGLMYFSSDREIKEEKMMTEEKTMTEEKKMPEEEMNQDEKETIGYVDIETDEAYQLMMNAFDLVILDVSPRFAKGHLPKAINYYVGDGSLDKAIPNLDKEKTYLVYCHVDSASIAGSEKLVEAGFMKVYRLKGNYGPWLEGGYPIEVEIGAVGDYKGNAIATRSFMNGKFMHTVKAKIADPAEGKFYEGWLVKGTSFFSTGKMGKVAGEFVLNYESAEDSRDYKNIVITQESEAQGLDGKPETHVLEGEFE